MSILVVGNTTPLSFKRAKLSANKGMVRGKRKYGEQNQVENLDITIKQQY
jgi:hypothetical protein